MEAEGAGIDSPVVQWQAYECELSEFYQEPTPQH